MSVPSIAPPAEPSFHAFSFTVPAEGASPSFVVAGSGEVPEGKANYRDHIVRPGDTSPPGSAAKAASSSTRWSGGWRRSASAGPTRRRRRSTPCTTSTRSSSDAIVPRGAAAHGISWHYCRPPVVGLDYEMDCRGIAVERVDLSSRSGQ